MTLDLDLLANKVLVLIEGKEIGIDSAGDSGLSAWFDDTSFTPAP